MKCAWYWALVVCGLYGCARHVSVHPPLGGKQPVTNIPGLSSGYVVIGYIPGNVRAADKITSLLARSGITAAVEGSKEYGIAVPLEERDRAIAILRTSGPKQGLRIKFAP